MSIQAYSSSGASNYSHLSAAAAPEQNSPTASRESRVDDNAPLEYPVDAAPDFFTNKNNPFYYADHYFEHNVFDSLVEVNKYFDFRLKTSEISENLFLGSRALSRKWKETAALHQHRPPLFAIVSCLADKERLQMPASLSDFYHELALDVKDNGSNSAAFKRQFDQAFDFIDQHIQGGKKVLVHCMAGQSRSATLLAAYLMKKNRWSKQMALYHIFQKRQIIYPFPPFLDLLAEYENELKEQYSRFAKPPI